MGAGDKFNSIVPMYRGDLDRISTAGCSTPGCNHENDGVFYFHSVCHPKASMEVFYDRKTGLLNVECSRCRKPVGVVRVEPRPLPRNILDAIKHS